ncbi:hypothetical protein T492DRAFT_842827 [Pavlovales sp. CCMP2436]|nr:hypothetical protein T492DRAFT_842827 [Pavlovales sp. CCMP2436]
MSMRAWPISQAKENIRIVFKLADALNFGKWSATPVGTCAIDNFKMWVSYIRIDSNVERQMVLDRGGIITVPTVDFVQTSTSVAAGSNYVSMPIAIPYRINHHTIVLSESTARTCVSAADYLNTAFVIGVSLQCFPMTEALGDGLLIDSTIILEINLGTQTSAIRLDAFVQMEKTLVFANGAITFDA